jgi:UDP-GlcNAc:undecaprenyl-phosphate/decaprenyl-phosphate GlcNAc-1-phosphate transferase
VLWIRTKNGKPWFVGDRNHFSHRLLDLGLSQMQSLLLILSLSLACGLGGLLLPYVSDTMAILIFAQTLMVLWVIHLLERASRRKVLLTRQDRID